MTLVGLFVHQPRRSLHCEPVYCERRRPASQPAATLLRTILALMKFFHRRCLENKMQKAHPPPLRVNIVARVPVFYYRDFLLDILEICV